MGTSDDDVSVNIGDLYLRIEVQSPYRLVTSLKLVPCSWFLYTNFQIIYMIQIFVLLNGILCKLLFCDINKNIDYILYNMP